MQHELDEQKTKVEDLQFRLEEESINRDDLQVSFIGAVIGDPDRQLVYGGFWSEIESRTLDIAA